MRKLGRPGAVMGLSAFGLETRGALERRCGQISPVKTGGLSLKEEA